MLILHPKGIQRLDTYCIFLGTLSHPKSFFRSSKTKHTIKVMYIENPKCFIISNKERSMSTSLYAYYVLCHATHDVKILDVVRLKKKFTPYHVKRICPYPS
jgi:hypothetical protein